MWIAFQNNYSHGVWACSWNYYPNCPDGGDWGKDRLVEAEPRTNLQPYSGRATQYSLFYAEADEVPWPFWSGPYGTELPYEAFRLVLEYRK